MKNNIDIVIEKIKKENRVGIMAHLVTGYPTFDLSRKIAMTLIKSGVDIIEIQIPFSDPMADGRLIVEACQESLEKGTTVRDSFKLAKFLNKSFETPIVVMTYANIVIHMGIEKFCNLCVKNGISGIIIPDLPYDSKECKELAVYSKNLGIYLIYVVSPAIEDNRLNDIKKQAHGFIYCTSRQGTTGTGKKISQDINLYLRKVRKGSTIPLAVGFGLSSREDFNLIKKYSEIGIVGSAIINIIKKNKSSKVLSHISQFISRLKKTHR